MIFNIDICVYINTNKLSVVYQGPTGRSLFYVKSRAIVSLICSPTLDEILWLGDVDNGIV